jgi:excisionase family DNA binding protein
VKRATMTAKESAVYVGTSYWQFLSEIKAGRIPHFRIGNRILCRRETLDAWMAAQEAASVAREPEQGRIRRLK